MKFLKFTKKELVAMFAVGGMVATSAARADAVDFSSMISTPVAAGAVAAIVAMGAVKIAPNFARWAVNKVANFF